MTELLQAAFEKTSQLPKDRQDKIAQMLLELVASDADLPRLTAEQIEQVKASVQEAESGIFASGDEVDEVYRKYGA